jgi:hypothetical protein
MTAPTKKQREYWERVRELGCMANNCGADNPEIHHCGTGMGGRKNHDNVVGLCYLHHRGTLGIHTLSRRRFQPVYGYEHDMLAKVRVLLGAQDIDELIG